MIILYSQDTNIHIQDNNYKIKKKSPMKFT